MSKENSANNPIFRVKLNLNIPKIYKSLSLSQHPDANEIAWYALLNQQEEHTDGEMNVR